MRGASEWFLSAEERGNPATGLNRQPDLAWTVGNRVEPLIHGATYFSRLVGRFATLDAGDQVLLTDWRGDSDELLGPSGPTLGDSLSGLARRGVDIQGLLWRSHPGIFGFNEGEASDLADIVNRAGGVLLLDARIRRGGSHHQKLVLLLHHGRPMRISPSSVASTSATGVATTSVMKAIRRPRRSTRRSARGRPGTTSRPRSTDRPSPISWRRSANGGTMRRRWSGPASGSAGSPYEPPANEETPRPAPALRASPPATGSHAVQVLRTYPAKRPPYPFAPDGERSIARMYSKALARARSFIYVEDQYFWSEEIARAVRGGTETRPPISGSSWSCLGTRIATAVLSGPTNRLGQLTMMDRLAEAGGDRFAIYDLENERGDAIYVHAKTVVIDDVFAMLGSDNMNRRSWTHDSELSIAVLDEEEDEREPRDPAGLGDGARRFARDLRLRLWREHLGATSDDGLVDASEGFDRWRDAAEALDAWHEGGERGERPPGRVRRHAPRPVAAWQRCGRGRSIERSSTPTAARAVSDDPAGSDRRVGSRAD